MNPKSNLNELRSRREFVTAIGGFFITVPFLSHPELLASDKVPVSPNPTDDLKKKVVAGWIVGEPGVNRTLSDLVDFAHKLCDPKISLDHALGKGRALPDLREIATKNRQWLDREWLQASQAIRRVNAKSLETFESARQWDIESIQRFARRRVEKLITDLDLKKLVEHSRLQELKFPNELKQWVSSTNQQFHEVYSGLEKDISKLPFIRGLAAGSEFVAHARLTKDELKKLGKDALTQVFGWEEQHIGLKKAFAGTNGIISVLHSHWGDQLKNDVTKLGKGFDQITSGLFSKASAALPGMACFAVAGAVAGVISGLFTSGKLNEIKNQLNDLKKQLGKLSQEMETVHRIVAEIDHKLDDALGLLNQIQEGIYDLRNGLAKDKLREFRQKILDYEDVKTELPRSAQEAAEIISAAFGISGVYGLAESYLWPGNLTEKSVTVLEPPNASAGDCANAILGALGEVSGKPTDHFPHPEVWQVGAAAALRAIPFCELDGRHRDEVTRIIKNGERIQQGLQQITDPANVEPMHQKLFKWWTKGKGGEILKKSLDSERKSCRYLKPQWKIDVHQEDLYHGPGGLGYRFWDSPGVDQSKLKPTLYCVEDNTIGGKTLYEVTGFDPFSDPSLAVKWEFKRDGKFVAANPNYKNLEFGKPFEWYRLSTYQPGRSLMVKLGEGRRSVPERTSSEQITVDSNGAEGVHFPAVTLAESYLTFGNQIPTSILRFSGDRNRPVMKILEEAYIEVERRNKKLRSAIETMTIRELDKGDLNKDLKILFGASCGAITIASWRKADCVWHHDGQKDNHEVYNHDISPRLFDGHPQIPACVLGILDILCRGWDYANPFIETGEVMIRFEQRLRDSFDRSLKEIKSLKETDNVAVIDRTIFDLKAAIGEETGL